MECGCDCWLDHGRYPLGMLEFDLGAIGWSHLIAGVAVLVAALSLWLAILARRSASKSAQRAEDAGERATRASERIASIQSTIFQGAAWSISSFETNSYLLTNTSALAAENVTLAHDPHDPHAQRMEWQDESGVTIEPWSATKFMIGYSMTTGPSIRRDIVVTWNRPGEAEVRTWRHPVPPPRGRT